MNTNDIYEKITNLIIELLENHIESDYTQSWFELSTNEVFAKNIVSNHIYNGINQLLLSFIKRQNQYSLNRWLTFKQIEALSGKIKKGSKAAPVVYVSHIYIDNMTGKSRTKEVEELIKHNLSYNHLDVKKIGYLKYYNCFNVTCVENLPESFYKIEEIEKLSEFENDERIEQLINNLDVKIDFSAENPASYVPSLDIIRMPLKKQFKDKESFYNVFFHECGHSTGHESRLNRNLKGKFGDKFYAFEELIAEINTAFICAFFGIENKITDNVQYINNWLQVMKNDTHFVIQAASEAQKASDYILQFAKVQEFIMEE